MAMLNAAFKQKIIELPIDKINYSKEITPISMESSKFLAIKSSIEEIGIIEPPVVCEKNGGYVLLDGHLRVEALKLLNQQTVQCLIATDDENYTYNKHVNRVANIQEHKMILKAIEKGASPEKIAKALNLDIDALLKKKNLLDGICPEVVELLKDKVIGEKVFFYLKKMKPERQIEAVNFMTGSSNFSLKFAKAIWQGSTDAQLVTPLKRGSNAKLEHGGRLESEVTRLQREYKIMEDGYGVNVLHLTLIKTYLHTLFQNPEINDFLKTNEPEIYQQLENIVEMDSMESSL